MTGEGWLKNAATAIGVITSLSIAIGGGIASLNMVADLKAQLSLQRDQIVELGKKLSALEAKTPAKGEPGMQGPPGEVIRMLDAKGVQLVDECYSMLSYGKYKSNIIGTNTVQPVTNTHGEIIGNTVLFDAKFSDGTAQLQCMKIGDRVPSISWKAASQGSEKQLAATWGHLHIHLGSRSFHPMPKLCPATVEKARKSSPNGKSGIWA